MNISRLPQVAPDDGDWARVLRLIRAVDGSSEADFQARLNAFSPAADPVDVEGMEIGLDPVSPAIRVAALRLLCHDLRALDISLASLRERFADPGWGTLSFSATASAG